MTITIELSGVWEERLHQEAAARGVSEVDYAREVLEASLGAGAGEASRPPRRPAAALQALALQQGVKPVERLEELLGAPGEDYGLEVDAFLTARREWRKQPAGFGDDLEP